MSYQIYDASDGSWVQVRDTGLFGYVFNPKEADVFARHDDAERAIARFRARLGPTGARFKIRTVEEPRAEYTRPDAKYTNYLLVGGPLDGQRYYIDGNEFVAQRPSVNCAAWFSTADLNDVLPTEQLVYMKHEILSGLDRQKQRNSVFVFAGIRGKRPTVGEFIMFRERNYQIVKSNISVTAERYVVGPGPRRTTTTISLLANALQYDFAWNAWVAHVGAEISSLESSTTVAP